MMASMNALDPRTHAIPPEVLELLPESLVRENCVLPALADERVITLFCPDDARFGLVDRERIQFILNRPVDWWPAQREVIQEAITQHLGELPAAIVNCDVKFRFRCPLIWEQLRPTDDAQVRYCEVCSKSVYRATDSIQADCLARQGKCVAYSSVSCDTMGLIEFD